MRVYLKAIIVLFIMSLVLAFASCNENKPQPESKPRIFEGYHPLMDEIVRSKSGVFRGLELNCNAVKIKETETSSPTEEETNKLFYEYKADSSISYSIDYTLSNDSLEEISLNVYCKDTELCSYLFCDLKDYYASKLPNPIEAKGQVVYNCFEGQRKPFVISLSDNSTPAKGILNLVIYKDR